MGEIVDIAERRNLRTQRLMHERAFAWPLMTMACWAFIGLVMFDLIVRRHYR